MKIQTFIAAGITAFLLSPAFAQDVVQGGLIEISPGDAILVERYVQEVPVPPPIIEEHMTLRPGSVIPEGVPLTKFEKAPSLARYGFFVSVDHKIVVADPGTRVVVRILDQKS